MRHAPVAVIRPSAFNRPAFSPSTPRRLSPIRYSSFVSFSVSSYPVSMGVSSIYRLVHTCHIRYTVPSGLARRVLLAIVSSPSVEHGIAIIPSTSPHISIIFSYPCILVSFIYIAYIIFIIYINRRATTDHAPIAKQPAVPPPVPPPLIGGADTRRERDSGKQATTSQTGDARTAPCPVSI